MTADHLKPKTLLLLCIVFLFISACGKSAPTRFYILHPLSDTGAASTADANETISITLLPVKMPEHLHRSQIVTRKSGHMLSVDESNRWAEPLDASFTLILAENLSLLLNTEKISVLSRIKYTEHNYRLSVDILRFDGQMGNDATLVCRWLLYGDDEKSALMVQRSRINRPVEGDTYQDLVAALSLIIADLSREIAEQISAYK